MRGQQRKQKGVDEGNHQQQLEARMPMPEARGFHGELSFGEAKRHLNLPTSHIDEDDLPGILDGFKRLIGQQIQGSTPFSGT